jgi:hypothetical protein
VEQFCQPREPAPSLDFYLSYPTSGLKFEVSKAAFDTFSALLCYSKPRMHWLDAKLKLWFT